MSAAELDALADRLMLNEYTTADLHAAARCARGWAKVEAELREHPGTSIDFVVGNKGKVICLGNFIKVIAGTAIEAVEAADVKP